MRSSIALKAQTIEKKLAKFDRLMILADELDLRIAISATYLKINI